MANFISPFTDISFKRIFGQAEHKEILMGFLNSLFEGEMRIVSIDYQDKERLADDNEHRTMIYDIYCTTDKGEHIIVEMQNRQTDNYLQRTLYYGAKAIVDQARKGRDFTYDVKAVYVISFMNFTMSGLPKKLKVDSGISDRETGKPINPFLRLIYIQLPFMNKGEEECDNNFERWIYILKNMENMSEIPAKYKEIMDELTTFECVAEESAMGEYERACYEKELKRVRDNRAILNFERKEGQAEGRAEGRNEEKIDIARRMKEAGMTSNLISDFTGLSKEQVESL